MVHQIDAVPAVKPAIGEDPEPADAGRDLEAQIVATAEGFKQAQCRLLLLVGRYDEGQWWVERGAPTCAHWLSEVLDVTLSTARTWVRVARALRSLPEIRRELVAGTLSYAKVRELTKIAKPDTESELVELARLHPAGRLASALAAWHAERDPEAARERQHQDRGVRFRTTPWGNRLLTLSLSPDRMAVIEARLEREVSRAPSASVEPGSTLAQQRADALCRMLDGSEGAPAGAPGRPAGSRPKCELVLHRRVGQVELDDGTPIPVAGARRLTCDADARVMTHLPGGTPADVGRRQRLVPDRLRALVHERDRHCQHPGCTATQFLEVHHIVHWEDGGPTDLANLELRCDFHHRFIHRRGGPVRAA